MNKVAVDTQKINRVVCKVSVFLFFILGAGKIQGATYYVATTGSDLSSNPGTVITSPLKTLTNAVAKATTAGDKVYIKAGSYSGNTIFKYSGTVAAPITFEGYKTTPGDNPTVNWSIDVPLNSADMPLLDGGNRATAGTAIGFSSKNGIVLKNIQIQNYNNAVQVYCANNCIVSNVIAVNLGDQAAEYSGVGIKITGPATNNLIKNCIVANASAEGIMCYADKNRIEDCKVFCNDSTHGITGALDYYLNIANGNSNTISGCYVERIGSLPHFGHGIGMKGACVGNVITNCVSVNMSEDFVARHSGVHSNLFVDCTALSTNYFGGGLCARDGAYSNTFRNCRTIGVSQGVELYDTTEDINVAGSSNRFENCVFEDSVKCISFFYYSTNGIASGNTFLNCTFDGGDYLFDCSRTNLDTKLINCIVTDVDALKTGTYPLNYSATNSDFYLNGFAIPSGVGNFSDDPFSYEYKACYHLNEASGATTASDSSGNGNTGTLMGMVPASDWVAGVSSNALNFDGVDAYVNCGTGDSFKLTNNMTLMAWIRPDTNVDYAGIIDKFEYGYKGYRLVLRSTGALCFWYGDGSLTYNYVESASSVITASTWQHVAITKNGTNIIFYVNGVPFTPITSYGLSTMTVATNALPLNIGKNALNSKYFDGKIDEVKILSDVLSPAEILAEAQQAVAFWKLDAQSQISDSTGNNNNGTAYSVTEKSATIGCSRWLEFTGASGSYVQIPDSSALNAPGNDLTISAWIRPHALTGSAGIVDKFGSVSTKYRGYRLILNNSALRLWYGDDSTTLHYATSSSGVLTLNEWQHVVVTKAGTTITFYVNGKVVSSTGSGLTTPTIVPYAGPLCIAKNPLNAAYFDGEIDEVKLFAKALTATEAEGLYDATLFDHWLE